MTRVATRAGGLPPPVPDAVACGAGWLFEGAAEVLGADVNALRPPAKLLIADMDSTMIAQECIDELADFAGQRDAVSAITERAMAGALDFEGALTARVALLEGLPEADLVACYKARIEIRPGAVDLIRTMRARGAYTALVSGGFTFFTSRIAAACGFDAHRANTLEFHDGRLTGRVIPPILGRDAKAAALYEMCDERGILPGDALALGDGANDLAMVRAAGTGVAFRAKAALKAEADAILEHSDLDAVLTLQGLAPA